jgi:DNA-binding NarL/FixJ family response regulator
MQLRKAREILDQLVKGVDPLSGEELPAKSVLQQADVIRALLAGSHAIGEVLARASRRAQQPQNIGRVWSEEEHRSLVDAFQAGEAVAEIAARHGRTVRAIESRLEKAGLLSRDQRTTSGRFES